MCTDFGDVLVDLGILDFDVDLVEEAWAWVDPSSPFQDATGVVLEKSKVASTDSYVTHDTHDFDFLLLLDEHREYLASPGNRFFDAMGVEWETGIFPGEKVGDGARPMFPKWAWPSIGDRVWANGHWVYDCGHMARSKYPSEIHPPRALASMRDQARVLPGTGSTPVPVTAVDLWIHGRGGFMAQQLYCGPGIILGPFGSCPRETTPIAENFGFEVCLPPQPFAGAQSASLTFRGPYNDVVEPDPRIELIHRSEASSPDLLDAFAACGDARDENGAPRYEPDVLARVAVDLRDTGIADDAVYSRRLYLGWVGAPDLPLRHLEVALNRMDLHDDKEFPGDNCECTFFWMNVDRSPFEEWARLSDFAAGMNDYDDDRLSGDGFKDFSGPVFDFYTLAERPFTVRATGYDQDCFDEFMGYHVFDPLVYIECGVREAEEYLFGGSVGHSDALAGLERAFSPPAYGVGRQDVSAGGEYELEFTIDEIALTDEDTADIRVSKVCETAGEVAMPGEPVTCTIRVANGGPGLPRNLVLEDAVSGSSGVTIDSTQFLVGERVVPCLTESPTEVRCELGTVPVDGEVVVTVVVNPDGPGSVVNVATASSPSTDPDAANDAAESSIEVFRPVSVDVQPTGPSTLNVSAGGVVPVAILGTQDFDATTVDPGTVCFGDAGAPAERSCREVHGTGHLEDVNRDRRRDLVFHFELTETGIDGGDASACLIGRRLDGEGVFGCDVIRTTW